MENICGMNRNIFANIKIFSPTMTGVPGRKKTEPMMKRRLPHIVQNARNAPMFRRGEIGVNSG